jgi:hypothetical protein
LILAARITLAQRSDSTLMPAANSSGVCRLLALRDRHHTLELVSAFGAKRNCMDVRIRPSRWSLTHSGHGPPAVQRSSGAPWCAMVWGASTGWSATSSAWVMTKRDPKKERELHPDGWARFERAMVVVAKSPPQYRTKSERRNRRRSNGQRGGAARLKSR